MRLTQINRLLTAAVIIFGLYLLILPLLPELRFYLRRRTNSNNGMPYHGKLASDAGDPGSTRADIPEDNRIVIPKLFVNAPVAEGQTINAINNGNAWHRPGSKAPGENGNIVLAGHRYFGKGDTAFYHLDRLAPGDKLALYWNGIEYLYIVTERKVVTPEDISIESPTDTEQLTLYTCTPLWTAKDRLVVTAVPIGAQQ